MTVRCALRIVCYISALAAFVRPEDISDEFPRYSALLFVVGDWPLELPLKVPLHLWIRSNLKEVIPVLEHNR